MSIELLQNCGNCNLTILANTDGNHFGLSPIYNTFMSRLLDEAFGGFKLLCKKELTHLVVLQDRLDNYRMSDTLENRKITVEWMWSLFNAMKCVEQRQAVS